MNISFKTKTTLADFCQYIGQYDMRSMEPSQMRGLPQPHHMYDPRSVDPRSVDPRSVDPRSVDPRSVDPRSVDPRSVDPRSVDPRSVDPRSVDPRSVDPRSVDPRAMEGMRHHSGSYPSNSPYYPPDHNSPRPGEYSSKQTLQSDFMIARNQMAGNQMR